MRLRKCLGRRTSLSERAAHRIDTQAICPADSGIQVFYVYVPQRVVPGCHLVLWRPEFVPHFLWFICMSFIS